MNIVSIPSRIKIFPRLSVAISGVFRPCVPRTTSVKIE